MTAPTASNTVPTASDIATLPKISLHDHLDGALRPQTIIDLAAEHGVDLPESDADALGRWFAAQSNSGSLVEYLKTFDVTTAVMQTEDALARVARDYVADLAADGVIYGEVRWAPEQHLAKGMSLDAAVEAVQAGLEEGMAETRRTGTPVMVTQLLSAMRHAKRATEIAELAVRHRGRGVVGFDIAGAEAGFPPSDHAEAFDLLAKEYVPVTVHAGEGDGVTSIEGALLDARALRLGHGVRIAEDITSVGGSADPKDMRLGSVATWVRDRHIALELSPSSNVQTGAIAAWGSAVADHPFDALYRLGFNVTVNTDNRLMSDTTLTRELSLVAETFGYGMAELEKFQLNAAAAAFVPLSERQRLASRIREGFSQKAS